MNKENALKTLLDLKEVLDSLNIKFWLSDGTLLGFHRESDFISHDPDIDIGIFIEDWDDTALKILKNKNFKLKWQFGLEECGLECLKTLATNDPNHPYVNYLKNLGDVYYIGGKVEKIEGIKHYDFLDYRLTPKKLKNITKSYDRILGFQTRNPMHNCHYYLTLNSLDKINTDNKILTLMPVVGITQNNDVDYSVRVRCYLHILEKYKKEGIKVQLCLLTLS
ncbi:unnamed protein product, partial [marine sediment metagenome]